MLREGRAQVPETSPPKVTPRHSPCGEQRAGVCSPSVAGMEEPGGQEATGQVQSLILRNPDPEFWRRIVKDSSLATNSLGRKKVSRQDTKNAKHGACH